MNLSREKRLRSATDSSLNALPFHFVEEKRNPRRMHNRFSSTSEFLLDVRGKEHDDDDFEVILTMPFVFERVRIVGGGDGTKEFPRLAARGGS